MTTAKRTNEGIKRTRALKREIGAFLEANPDASVREIATHFNVGVASAHRAVAHFRAQPSTETKAAGTDQAPASEDPPTENADPEIKPPVFKTPRILLRGS